MRYSLLAPAIVSTLMLSLAACGDSEQLPDASSDDLSAALPDLSTTPIDFGNPDGFLACAGSTCPQPFSCKHDACVPDLGTCTTSADCPGDSYCDVDKTCVPFGVPPSMTIDPACDGNKRFVTIELTDLDKICAMTGQVTLTAKICNRGTADASAPSVALFNGYPRVDAGQGKIHLCNASFPAGMLTPGNCVAASCTATINEDLDIYASLLAGGISGTSCYGAKNSSAGSFQLCPPVL